jgi:hypothetical protein
MLRICLFFLLSFSLLACRDTGEIIVVPDNTAPPDYGVAEVIKENYLNRLYISLLGRKATEVEFSAGMTLLDQSQTSPEDRRSLIAEIIAQPEFAQRMYDVARVEILNNLDTADVSERILLYEAALQDPLYADFISLLQTEIARMKQLRSIPTDLMAGTIDRQEMHRRCVDNVFFDEINMGNQNFVLAMFEYFLGRYPTEAEEEKAIAMVDGFNSVLFGAEGNSKQEFIDLFLGATDYFEGEVVDAYQDFLFRRPSSQEMSAATVRYQQSGDYQQLLLDLLSTDEYLGL